MTTLIQDPARTTQDLLAEAESAFASGDMLGGSWKMWEASACALKAVVQPLGWPCDSHNDLLFAAKRLAKEAGDDMIRMGFGGSVSYFYYNSQYDFMGDEDDFDMTGELVRGFISRVLALIGADLGRRNGSEPC